MKNNIQLLEDAIMRTEQQLANQVEIVRFRWDIITHSLKPSTILSEVFQSVKQDKETKNSIIEYAISFVGGYFSKRLIMGSSNSFWKKILGYGIQYVSTKYISKKVDVHLP